MAARITLNYTPVWYLNLYSDWQQSLRATVSNQIYEFIRQDMACRLDGFLGPWIRFGLSSGFGATEICQNRCTGLHELMRAVVSR